MRAYLHVVRNLLRHPQAEPAFFAPASDELLEGRQPTHAPRLVPRDEAAFLLNAAAEIEHALMVQYLSAAYSIRIVEGEAHAAELGMLQQQFLQIAREEMGHLMTVENLLLLIGAPLNFYREHSPFASEIYPFRFKLEPLSLASLAKYVVAESPATLPPDLPEADRALYETGLKLALQSNDGHDVLHVGPIFARLKMLFEAGPDGLAGEDFRLDRAAFQETYRDWGFDQPSSDGDHRPADDLIVESFPHPEVGPGAGGSPRGDHRRRPAGRRLRHRHRRHRIALRALLRECSRRPNAWPTRVRNSLGPYRSTRTRPGNRRRRRQPIRCWRRSSRRMRPGGGSPIPGP